MNRTYLINTQALTPTERKETLDLLDLHGWLHSMLAKNPFVFMVHTECSADEFATIPFPNGCVVTDITGQDLLRYF